MDPDTQPGESPVSPAPAPTEWNRVQRWLGDMEFDEFVASEPEAPTIQPMTDEEIVDHVCTENDAPQEESEDEEDLIPSASTIKNTTEFLAFIDQQRAFLK